MKKVFAKCLLSAVVSVFVFCTCACGNVQVQKSTDISEDSGSKNILSVVMPSYDENKLNALKNFKSNDKITFIKGDRASYVSKLKVLLSSDDVPDVFFTDDENFTAELFSKDLVQPCDTQLSKIGYWDDTASLAKLKGHNERIYAVPVDEIEYGIFEYNKDFFKEYNIKVPTNFDELQDDVSLFKSKGIIPIAAGGKDGKIVEMMVEQFANTCDLDFTKKIALHKTNFLDDAFLKTAGRIKKLIDMKAFEDNANTVSDMEAQNLFVSGKAAMYFTSSKNFSSIKSKMGEMCGMMYYPVVDNSNIENYGKIPSGGVEKDKGLFISNCTKNPLGAVKIACQISKCCSQYMYENQYSPMTFYKAQKLGWKNAVPYVDNNTSTAFLYDEMPEAVSNALMTDSSAFMTGLMSVDDYAQRMDSALSLK